MTIITYRRSRETGQYYVSRQRDTRISVNDEENSPVTKVTLTEIKPAILDKTGKEIIPERRRRVSSQQYINGQGKAEETIQYESTAKQTLTPPTKTIKQQFADAKKESESKRQSQIKPAEDKRNLVERSRDYFSNIGAGLRGKRTFESEQSQYQQLQSEEASKINQGIKNNQSVGNLKTFAVTEEQTEEGTTTSYTPKPFQYGEKRKGGELVRDFGLSVASSPFLLVGGGLDVISKGYKLGKSGAELVNPVSKKDTSTKQSEFKQSFENLIGFADDKRYRDEFNQFQTSRGLSNGQALATYGVEEILPSALVTFAGSKILTKSLSKGSEIKSSISPETKPTKFISVTRQTGKGVDVESPYKNFETEFRAYDGKKTTEGVLTTTIRKTKGGRYEVLQSQDFAKPTGANVKKQGTTSISQGVQMKLKNQFSGSVYESKTAYYQAGKPLSKEKSLSVSLSKQFNRQQKQQLGFNLQDYNVFGSVGSTIRTARTKRISLSEFTNTLRRGKFNRQKRNIVGLNIVSKKRLPEVFDISGNQKQIKLGKGLSFNEQKILTQSITSRVSSLVIPTRTRASPTPKPKVTTAKSRLGVVSAVSSSLARVRGTPQQTAVKPITRFKSGINNILTNAVNLQYKEDTRFKPKPIPRTRGRTNQRQNFFQTIVNAQATPQTSRGRTRQRLFITPRSPTGSGFESFNFRGGIGGGLPTLPSYEEPQSKRKRYKNKRQGFRFEPSFTATLLNLRGGKRPRIVGGGFNPFQIRRISAR